MELNPIISPLPLSLTVENPVATDGETESNRSLMAGGIQLLGGFQEPDGFRGVVALQCDAREVESGGIPRVLVGALAIPLLNSGELAGKIVLEQVYVAALDGHVAGILPQQILGVFRW